MKLKTNLFLLLCISLTSSCGEETSFSSAMKKAKAEEKKPEAEEVSTEAPKEETATSDATAAEETVEPEDAVLNTEEITGSATLEPKKEPATKEASLALSECAKKWEDLPFSKEELAEPATITINQGIQNGELAFSDPTGTTEPQLLLLNYDVKNANQGQFDLLNPNGWYCLNILAKVINNFTVNAHCDSKIAIITKSAQSENGFSIIRKDCPE